MWHTLDTIRKLDTGEWCTDVQVPAESSWFSGHFPGDPILPAIAQLGMTCEAVCQAMGAGFRVAGFSRIKFKKIVRPGDCLKISVLPKKDLPGQYAFRISAGDDIACNGTIALERRSDPVDPGRV